MSRSVEVVVIVDPAEDPTVEGLTFWLGTLGALDAEASPPVAGLAAIAVRQPGSRRWVGSVFCCR